jgi:hypothetical protein
VESSEREEGEKAAGAMSRTLDRVFICAKSSGRGLCLAHIFSIIITLSLSSTRVTTVKQVKAKE